MARVEEQEAALAHIGIPAVGDVLTSSMAAALLVERPLDARILGKQIVREILYHILLGPWGNNAVGRVSDLLDGYDVNKKTIKVPVDWKPDKNLLLTLIANRLAELSR